MLWIVGLEKTNLVTNGRSLYGWCCPLGLSFEVDLVLDERILSSIAMTTPNEESMNDPCEIPITLSSRPGVPSSTIFTKQYVLEKLGDRNTIILLPGGPGNDMGMYDDPDISIAQTFFQVADVILFDPRSCVKSESCDMALCSLEHYIDDVEAIRHHFNIKPGQFFVFGQSYGSIVALGYAIRYNNSLRKLLLIGAVASSDFYDEAREKLKEIGTPE